MIWLRKWIGDQIWVDLREEFFFRQYTINVLVSLAVLFSDLLKGTIEDSVRAMITFCISLWFMGIWHVVLYPPFMLCMAELVDSDRWLQLLISDVRWIFWRLDVFSFKFLRFVGLWNPIRIGNHHIIFLGLIYLFLYVYIKIAVRNL